MTKKNLIEHGHLDKEESSGFRNLLVHDHDNGDSSHQHPSRIINNNTLGTHYISPAALQIYLQGSESLPEDSYDN